MSDNYQTVSPTQDLDKKIIDAYTSYDSTSSHPSGTSSGNKSSFNWTRLAEIIGIVVGIITLIGFAVSIIITQINMNNSIQTLSNNVSDYKGDNILIKTQIENWFNKIDNKVDNIKDLLKK